MINSNTNDQPIDVFKEGMIDSVLKQVGDVDTEQIKKDWDEAETAGSKLKSINDNGLEKAKGSLGAIDKTVRKNQVDTRSIIARAKNSVLQFPIYVTQTLRVNEAQIIAKMFERVYATLVQTVLSQNQILSEDEANNLVFLKRFHTNLKEAANVLTNKYYEPIDDIDRMMYESIFYSQQLTENCTVDFSVVPCTDQDLILENARLMNEPLTGFIYLREKTEETETTNVSAKFVTLSDSDLEDMAAEKYNISESDKRLANKSSDEIRKEHESRYGKSKDNDTNNKNKARLAQAQADQREARKKLDDAVSKLKEDIKEGKLKEYKYKDGRFVRNEQNKSTIKTTKTDNEKSIEKAVDAPKLLRDGDIKKINAMTPYTIEATFRLKTKEGTNRDVKYIIGIKSVMHLIRTSDLSEDLHELVTGNIKSLQKVRYKTGEIKFADYFFNLKNLKSDAAKHINYNKRWVNTLKRLADYNKMNGALMKRPVEAITGGNVPIPNGTLILAQTDVSMLTNQTGIDLSIVSNAKRLAKSLFLIAVVIVDSSAGSMRVLFPDSDNDWDVQSLAAIDAELAKTDNSQLMKELNRMVNR